MKKIRVLLFHTWQPIMWSVIGVGLISLFLLYHLGSQPSGLSPGEIATVRASSNLHSLLLHKPLYLPYYLLEHFVVRLFQHSIFAIRAIGVIYGIVAAVIFFVLLRFWEGKRIAIVGTAMFTTSNWFLHLSRTNSSEILFFSVLVPIAAGLWFKHSRHRMIAFYIGLVVTISLLYVPGMIWFLVAAIIWQRKLMSQELQRISLVNRSIGLVIVAVILTPLVWASVHHISLLLNIVGFQTSLSTLSDMWHHFIYIPLDLFIKSSLNPSQALGHLPLFDVFEDVMGILGVYSLWHYRQLDRCKVICFVTVISIVLITFGGINTITMIVPLVYIVISRGIAFMISQWNYVFPLNPIVKYVGIGMLIATVAVSCAYQAENYYTAWQQAPATQALFIHSAADI